MCTIILLMFLYYVQFTPYGFYSMALFLIAYMVMGLFTYFLLNFEIPALNWNPFHHYTPSVEQPRTLFFPAFSLSWYHDLPQMWTMFYPLFGRSTFTPAQMSLVDRNHILLNNTLTNALQSRNAGMQMNNSLVEMGVPPDLAPQAPLVDPNQNHQGLHIYDPAINNIPPPNNSNSLQRNNAAVGTLNSSNSNPLMLDMHGDIESLGRRE